MKKLNKKFYNTWWFQWIVSPIGTCLFVGFILNSYQKPEKQTTVTNASITNSTLQVGDDNKAATYNGPITINFNIYSRSGEGVAVTNSQQEKLIPMLAVLNQIDLKFKSELASNFSFGYCLVGITDRNVVVPKESLITEHFRIDWQSVRIKNETIDSITFLLPELYAKSTDELIATGNSIVVPKAPWKIYDSFCFQKEVNGEYKGQVLSILPIQKVGSGWV